MRRAGNRHAGCLFLKNKQKNAKKICDPQSRHRTHGPAGIGTNMQDAAGAADTQPAWSLNFDQFRSGLKSMRHGPLVRLALSVRRLVPLQGGGGVQGNAGPRMSARRVTTQQPISPACAHAVPSTSRHTCQLPVSLCKHPEPCERVCAGRAPGSPQTNPSRSACRPPVCAASRFHPGNRHTATPMAGPSRSWQPALSRRQRRG